VLGWTTALRRSGVRSATKLQQLGDKKLMAEKTNYGKEKANRSN
jgi:hypothetical protein